MFKLLLVALAAVLGFAAASPAYYTAPGLYSPTLYSSLPYGYNTYPLAYNAYNNYNTYPSSLGYSTLPLAYNYNSGLPLLWKKK